MVAIVSTPWWKDIPDDQNDRCRHFIESNSFKRLFPDPNVIEIINIIDDNTNKRYGGVVGAFEMCLQDLNGEHHEFFAETFYNQHYLLSLIVYKRKLTI